MSSATPRYEVGAVVLGYFGLVASWRRSSSVGQFFGWDDSAPMLMIHASADTEDGAHIPAASVTINSREGLIALRSAIDEALKEGGAA